MTILDSQAQVRHEAQMISAVLAGDTELYYALIQPYELSVYRIARSVMKNESDAEDVAQEAFLKAFRSLADFRFLASFRVMLISHVLNFACPRFRRQKKLKMESLDDFPERRGGIIRRFSRTGVKFRPSYWRDENFARWLEQAIDTLSPICREVRLMRDVVSTEEASAALTISISSVKVRLHRARIILQKELAPKLKSVNSKKRWFPWWC